MKLDHTSWWNNLRHGGMLLDIEQLASLVELAEKANESDRTVKQIKDRVRRTTTRFQDDPDKEQRGFVSEIMEWVCGFNNRNGTWYRESSISSDWSRLGFGNARLRPQHLWLGQKGAVVPVFIDSANRLGIHRGTRVISRALQWLRKGREQMAVITNGRQWRILFAGMDYEAWVEWDIDQWYFEGELSPEFYGFRILLNPALWIPETADTPTPFLHAIQSSRKGQAELSFVLGERVRQATEVLIQAHAPALNRLDNRPDEKDIYRAAVRMVMRIVIGLFAESREGLLPKDNPVYNSAYSLSGLRELLERTHPSRLRESYYAWPRLISLMRLFYHGSDHEGLPVTTYGGDLFAPGEEHSSDDMRRTIHLFEHACFHEDVMSDRDVQKVLNLLSRTKKKIRQGRTSSWFDHPVDFSRLASEYIGILYEGLLDFELKQARPDEPIIFLGVGQQPALPLAALEAMDDKAIADLLKNEKKAAKDESGSDEEEEPEDESTDGEIDQDDEEDTTPDNPDTDTVDDVRYSFDTRAQQWAERAVRIGKLVNTPKGRLTPEKQDQVQRDIQRATRRLVSKLVLPGEWYLVRWGGTRKGSGTFYTRPQLAIPTVHRTLQPLCFDPPDKNGKPNPDAPAAFWVPKKPEAILSLKVCDPACGSGSFLIAALRYLTDALYESLILHERIREAGERSLLELIYDDDHKALLSSESIPTRYGDDDFEPRTKVILRRYVVERCIYGVDLDPLAVELTRLSLWLETLDSSLPMTFLDHKIKVGNSLVGAWFDQFLHYPIMAWEREGGDTNHNNGVHYKKKEWTKAIKEKAKTAKSDLIRFIDGGRFATLFPVDLSTVRTEHDDAVKALNTIHSLGIAQVEERAERYQELRDSEGFKKIKEAFDLWCALWFWFPDELNEAPMPTDFAEGRLSDRGREIVQTLAADLHFFHWELEFPDVFNVKSEGFDAVVGNPPWDISKPVSKEFFSEIDPLFRSYGKQEAINRQTEYFELINGTERRWLNYSSFFRALSNWMKYAGYPFGNRETSDSSGRLKHDLPLGERGKDSFRSSQARHERWQRKREQTTGYADEQHAFRHQGGGDINLYKTFLEKAHTLLRQQGRMGLIVPSGLYSDHGTGELRRLFLDQSQWEWLFGFENREGIFDIHRSFKFNPVIVQKGGKTEAIRTAFMRRNLADWEKAEAFAIEYPYEQVMQFSPKSRAILEIQSRRDLEILTKIYSNSVLLGDQGPDGWGIKYAREFDMTNDSRLFPPRPKWEEWGYKPDEYSRWIKGPWKPIAELWAELGIDPARVTSLDPDCARAIEEGIARGEVGRTHHENYDLFTTADTSTPRHLRCAQPPYDTLPIPRADIPAGILLSRNADEWLREEEIPIVTFTDANGKPLIIKKGAGKSRIETEVRGPAIALPLYEGRMIGQFDFSNKGWVSGKGRTAVWRDIPWERKVIEPQYLMGDAVHTTTQSNDHKIKWLRVGFMDISSATNMRTMISTLEYNSPNGNSAPIFTCDSVEILCGILCSYSYDYLARLKMSGLHLNYFVVDETALPKREKSHHLSSMLVKLGTTNIRFAPSHIRKDTVGKWPLSNHERSRFRLATEALVALEYDINYDDLRFILSECDYPSQQTNSKSALKGFNPKGFWRVDKDKPPELRQTVLTLVAFHDLQEKIEACGGDRDKGIEAFLNQNDGEGWMLPETLRLADYGLGHDERAFEYQPVRSKFGPRFYDWQLAQTPEESWRECHLHARNLLGKEGYQRLLDEIAGKPVSSPEISYAGPRQTSIFPDPQGDLFE